MSDDAELIEQTLAGRPAAFGELVHRYQDRLYNTVLHVVGNAEDARDVVQEALIQAFLKLDTFQGTSQFYTWLYRIAFNVAATFRRRRRQVASVDAVREMTGVEPVDGSARPSEQMEAEERHRQVHEAISRLGEEYRVVLVLREIEGFCYEMIAEMLDLPIGTVRSRLHRARSQLRAFLRDIVVVDDETP